jgi:hypothetical protein
MSPRPKDDDPEQHDYSPTLIYRAQFAVRYENTCRILSTNKDGFTLKKELPLYPDNWEVETTCEMGASSWVTFEERDSNPFKKEDLARVAQNLKEIDDAFDVIGARAAQQALKLSEPQE